MIEKFINDPNRRISIVEQLTVENRYLSIILITQNLISFVIKLPIFYG